LKNANKNSVSLENVKRKGAKAQIKKTQIKIAFPLRLRVFALNYFPQDNFDYYPLISISCMPILTKIPKYFLKHKKTTPITLYLKPNS